ncbi:MAG: ECF transporter S component [Ruminiclostridium sp.]|nr:ECF transporter S component [Ruminiclostridium sp.]
METNENKITDPTEKAGTAEVALNGAANRKYISTIVGVGVMTAVVVVLQLLSSVIHFGPFSITLALTAIIVGGAVYGIWAGAWLGFAMALTVLLSGDAAAFMTINVFGTILTVIGKSTAAGLLASLVYKLLEKKSRFGAVIAAGITAPVVNTGIFIAGTFLFFLDTITEWAGQVPVIEYIFTGLIGLNFPVELMVNLALSTVTVTIIGIVKRSMAER